MYTKYLPWFPATPIRSGKWPMSSVRVFVYMCLVAISISVILLWPNLSNIDKMHLSKHQSCAGHFHLCQLKRVFQENKLYGNLSFDQSVYNFSVISKFRTNVYKTRPDEELSIQHFVARVNNSNGLNRNLLNRRLNKKQSALICSFKPFKHFKYNIKYLRTIFKGISSTLLFSVEEIVLNKTFPHKAFYYGPAVLPNIQGDITTSKTRMVCDVTNFIKGTYSIECPILEKDFKISFYASFLPPSIYYYICPEKDNYLIKEFKSEQLKPRHFWKASRSLRYLDTPRCSSDVRPQGLGFWVNRGRVWHWSTVTCHYSFSFDTHVRQCLREKSILMIGDSHMTRRIRAFGKYNLAQPYFRHSTVVAETLDTMKRFLSGRRFSYPLVVVLNSGHWSLHYQDVSSYISDMEELIAFLKTKTNTLKIIWLETMARPYNNYHFRWKINPVIAALNDWTNHRMRNIGVEIIPSFQMSLIMRSRTRDGSHFYEFLEQDVILKKNKVSVGGAIDAVIIDRICPA